MVGWEISYTWPWQWRSVVVYLKVPQYCCEIYIIKKDLTESFWNNLLIQKDLQGTALSVWHLHLICNLRHRRSIQRGKKWSMVLYHMWWILCLWAMILKLTSHQNSSPFLFQFCQQEKISSILQFCKNNAECKYF